MGTDSGLIGNMKQLHDLFRDVLENGSWQQNRTGIRTISVPGTMARFDLTKGFPAVTTKRLAFKAVTGELVGFLRGATSAADFRALGCKVWDQNANENAAWLANPYRAGTDDIGEVYGALWRRWPAFKVIELGSEAGAKQMSDAMSKGYEVIADIEGTLTAAGSTPRSAVLTKTIDQLRGCLDTIHTNPTDRRILYHAWNPATLDEIALPACHLLKNFFVNVEKREISMVTYMRSVDLGLGLPFNVASEAAMLALVGRLTGYTPKWLTMQLGDTHIYENHLDMVAEQLNREPLPLPQLKISDRVPAFSDTGVYAPEWLDLVVPSDFELVGYEHHGVLTAPMAV